MSGCLRSLPSAVSSRVRSAQSLESLADCVLELVQNSVDAGASSLVVKVDTAAWSVKVSDNGRGIAREGLQSLVGERYASSKHQHQQCFGFRGEALASIVQVAQSVAISSRHRLSQLTCCKLFKGGRSSGLVPPPASLNQAGTAVTVTGIFHNLPVRRRHMSPSLEMEKLRNSLCRVLLVLPFVSLFLHDDQTGQRVLHAPKASSLLTRFHQLYGSKSVQQRDMESEQVKASALLSLHSLGRNSLQLIFLNGRAVEWESMHELVTRVLKPANQMASTKQHLFYVITIDCEMEFSSQLTPGRTHLHLEQEKRVAKALTSLISSFLYSNDLPTSHCLPHPASKLSRSSRLVSATTTQHPSPSPRPPPPPLSSSQTPTPSHWKVAKDPATSRRLQIHPVTGSSLRHTPSLGPQEDKKNDNSYYCAVQSLPQYSSRPKFRAATGLSSLAKASLSAASVTSNWTNPTFSAGEEAVLNVGKTHNSFSQYKFSKESLKHTRVLGQVDKKFIACLFGEENSGSPKVLVVMDQHAAHERVRLEDLIKELYSDGGKVKMDPLVPPFPLSLSPQQQRVARYFCGKLEAIGVKLVWREGRPVASTAPAVLVGRGLCSAALLQDMVRSHLEVLTSTSGGSSGLPSCLSDVLHSQACHGAIRFGDYLDVRQCVELMHSLAKCNLPFQCAHGRPSLAPLISLHVLNKRCPSLVTPFPSLTRLRISSPIH